MLNHIILKNLWIEVLFYGKSKVELVVQACNFKYSGGGGKKIASSKPTRGTKSRPVWASQFLQQRGRGRRKGRGKGREIGRREREGGRERRRRGKEEERSIMYSLVV